MRSKPNFTVKLLEDIRKMQDKNITAFDCSSFSGRSYNQVLRCYHILDSVHNGKMIPYPQHYYSTKAVRDYCTKHGLQYIPYAKKEETPAAEAPAPDKTEELQHMVSTMNEMMLAATALTSRINDLATALYNLI